jgi:hypothetical protein
VTAWGVLLFTGGCLVAVLSGLIKDEIRGWLDLVPYGILRLAALLLESGQRKTIYEDEWIPELYHILRKADTRPISRLFVGIHFAFGLLVSVRGISRRINRESQIDASSPNIVPGDSPRESLKVPDRLTPVVDGDETVLMMFQTHQEVMNSFQDTYTALNMENSEKDQAQGAAAHKIASSFISEMTQ